MQTKSSPFGKGGLRGIFAEVRNRGLLRKSPLTPLFQRGEIPIALVTAGADKEVTLLRISALARRESFLRDYLAVMHNFQIDGNRALHGAESRTA